MSPFTADSETIVAMLKDEGLWKILQGPILSIRKISSKTSTEKNTNAVSVDQFEIMTEDSGEKMALVVTVTTKRDFMVTSEPRTIEYGKPHPVKN